MVKFLVCYSDFDIQTTLGNKIEPRYYQIDTTEKVRLSDSIKDFIWKQNTEFNFDDLKKPFVSVDVLYVHRRRTRMW